MTHTENNILLAEFLGVKQKENNWFDGYELQKAGLPFNYGAMGNGTGDLKFHTSWDWLILVVDKIENLGFNVTIGAGEYCRISESFATPDFEFEIEIEYDGSKLDCVYSACVAFVKEYNKQYK